jgi:Tol biopolymer transport system component
VFEWVTPDGNNDLYITEVAGGEPTRLTREESRDISPAWSPDGATIYFASDRSGTFQIWKMPAQGGPASPVSPGFGIEPQASADGQYIYYLSCLPPTPCPLKRIPATGGPETIVLDRVTFSGWSVTSRGVYLLSRDQKNDWLDLFDPATGERARLGSLPFKPNFGGLFCGFVSVSPDGRSVVGNHVDRFDSNLMIMEISR